MSQPPSDQSSNQLYEKDIELIPQLDVLIHYCRERQKNAAAAVEQFIKNPEKEKFRHLELGLMIPIKSSEINRVATESRVELSLPYHVDEILRAAITILDSDVKKDSKEHHALKAILAWASVCVEKPELTGLSPNRKNFKAAQQDAGKLFEKLQALETGRNLAVSNISGVSSGSITSITSNFAGHIGDALYQDELDRDDQQPIKR